MKKALIAITAVLLTLSVVTAAFAAGNSECRVIYGGGEVCEQKIQFTIDKKVQRPNSNDFVDNISINETRFTAGATVAFKIIVKNTGDKTIEKLDVVDTLPQSLNFTSGPGTYNASNRTLSYTITNLKPGDTNEQTINATVAKDIAAGVLCFTNTVSGTDNRGIVANDSASLCAEQPQIVTKPTPPVIVTVPPKSIPNTGPEMFSLIALVPAALGGIALRKKSKLN